MLAAINTPTVLGLAVLIVFVITGWGRGPTVKAIDLTRLSRLDAKLDAILRELGVRFADPTAPEGLSKEVKALAFERQRIAAIARHRELTGLGLCEAKQAVDAYVVQLEAEAGRNAPHGA